jgi:tyrosyl-tRNA synthetase
MSIPDELIINYFNYATKVDPDEIDNIQKELESGTNPKIIKQRLAREIVALYHGEESAFAAENHFNTIFSKKKIPDDMPEFSLESSMKLTDVLTAAGLCKTNGEVKRLIKQNAISINEVKISEIDCMVTDNAIIKVGKRRFLKVILSR